MMQKNFKWIFLAFFICLAPLFSLAEKPLPARLQEIQLKFFTRSYHDFLSKVKVPKNSNFDSSSIKGEPEFNSSLSRNDWLIVFSDFVWEQSDLKNTIGKNEFQKFTLDQFSSYYHNVGFARVPYLQPQTLSSSPEKASVQSINAIQVPTTYPTDHTLDVNAYVDERFPNELQKFAQEQAVPVFFHDTDCDSASAYHSQQGYTNDVRFMGMRESAESQFVFAQNADLKYRLVICDIIGNDDLTRMSAIIGPAFSHSKAFVVHHQLPRPIFTTDKPLNIDSQKDIIIIGYQNTVWWLLSQSAEGMHWNREILSNQGTEVDLFYNNTTQQKIYSVANIYGDETLQLMDKLYAAGARRFIYLGSSGGLDSNLNLGDVLIPTKFQQIDGSWEVFDNDATKENFTLQVPSRIIENSQQGWVGTLIEETKPLMRKFIQDGVQAIDVETKYFAHFLNTHEVLEKKVILVISDIPLGTQSYNQESVNRTLPMKSINQLIPQLLKQKQNRNPASIDPALVEELSGKLTKILEPRIKTLDRDMITFHYEVGDNSKMDESSLDIISRWMLGKPVRFFKSSVVDGNMVGPGLYLAVDPVASRSFGNNSPQLSVVKVKSGARMVDLFTQPNPDEAAFLKEIYSKISCVSSNSSFTQLNSFNETLTWLRSSQTPECVSIAINAFQILQPQAIIYSYSGSNLDNCRDRSYAINVIDSNAAEVVAYFSEKTQHDSQQFGPYISNLYNEAINDYFMQLSLNGSIESPPKTLMGNVSPTDYQNWKESKILNCGPKWATESNIDNFNTIVRKNLKKYSDLRNTIIQTKRAFDKIFKGTIYFNFERMRIVEMMEYEKSDLAKDMSKYNQWQQAKDMLFKIYSDPKASPQFSSLLEESEPTSFNFQTYQGQFFSEFNALKDTDFEVLDFFYKFYIKIGIGPRLAQMMINNMISYYGAPPMFIDSGEFKKALQHCIDVYNDPNQTQETIKNGECGIRASN